MWIFYVAILHEKDSKSDVGWTSRIRCLMNERVFEGFECPERPAIKGTLTFVSYSKDRYQVDVKCLTSKSLQNSLHCIGLALTIDGLYLRSQNISSAGLLKKDLSFLLSIKPVKIREFLGLPDHAFDKRRGFQRPRFSSSSARTKSSTARPHPRGRSWIDV